MDRRAYPRFPIDCPVRFRVNVQGDQFLVSEFSSSGTVLDISRNGMLAQVDRLLAVGTNCTLSLVGVDSVVRPHEVRGHVRRSSMGDAGWKLGIEFDSLVDVFPDAARQAAAEQARPA